MPNTEITFVIKEKIGKISDGSKGWNRELNLVSWNGREAKLDIRDWDLEHVKMSKGITLTVEEARSLVNLLSKYLEDKL